MTTSITLQRFYASKRWTDLRKSLIVQSGGVCSMCGEIISDHSRLVCHHIIELTDDNYFDANIALNPENIKIVCTKCHNRIHERGYQFSQKKSVFIVYGAPCSGKTSYVRQRMTDGDLVLDLDSIWMTISQQPRYTHPRELRSNAFGVRDELLNQIRVRIGGWSTAWVIGGYPLKSERDALADRLGASAILIEATLADCLARLERDTDREKEIWTRLVHDWFENYQPDTTPSEAYTDKLP